MAELDRGLVVSCPMEIEVGHYRISMKIKNQHLDPQEVRLYALFWERLVWPKNTILKGDNGPDAEFLISEGVLTRPVTDLTMSTAMGFSGQNKAIADAHLNAFQQLEQNEPGRWALAHGEKSFLSNMGHLSSGRAFLVDLHRAIPVPDVDVPLDDILNFRRKRAPELARLRAEIDSFYANIEKASDKNFELQKMRK